MCSVSQLFSEIYSFPKIWKEAYRIKWESQETENKKDSKEVSKKSVPIEQEQEQQEQEQDPQRDKKDSKEDNIVSTKSESNEDDWKSVYKLRYSIVSTDIITNEYY